MAASRFTEKHWINLGFDALRTSGISALTIEELCNRANKTRGSFYFHFPGIDGFLIRLTEEWKSKFTDEIVSLQPKSIERLDILNLLAARLDLPLESGIRQLAVTNTNVQRVVGAADQRRIEWLTYVYQLSGFAIEERAKDLAEIEYSAFVGFRLIKPGMASAEAKRMYDAFLSITGREL